MKGYPGDKVYLDGSILAVFPIVAADDDDVVVDHLIFVGADADGSFTVWRSAPDGVGTVVSYRDFQAAAEAMAAALEVAGWGIVGPLLVGTDDAE